MKKKILIIYGILVFLFTVLLVMMLLVYGPRSTESTTSIRVVLKGDISAEQRMNLELYIRSMPEVISMKYMTSQEQMEKRIEQVKKRLEQDKKLEYTKEQIKEYLNRYEATDLRPNMADEFPPAEYVTVKIKDNTAITKRLWSRPEIATKRTGKAFGKEIFSSDKFFYVVDWNRGLWKIRVIFILSYVTSLILITVLLVIISLVLSKRKARLASVASSDGSEKD